MNKNSYYNTMSKITINEEFKKQLIENLENEATKKYKKGGIFMKIKKIIITIISIVSTLICSGAVYAALGGTINGVPVLEWMGIKFSEKYVEYVEPVTDNQVLENKNTKVTLESTVCDDGFSILQFRINIAEDMINSYNDSENEDFTIELVGLSFNDPLIHEYQYNTYYLDLGGANYNLIIDGKNFWLRGYSAQSIEKISNTEYLVYQMYFLDDTILDQKTNFEITLNNVVVMLGEEYIDMNGSFNVELSKDRALNNTTKIKPEGDTTLKYKKMETTIEEINITPLQTIIKVKNIYRNINQDDLLYTLDEDFVGELNYLALDKKGNKLMSFSATTESKITYEDGVFEKCIPNEYSFSREEFENATYEETKIIAIESKEEISEIELRVYELLEYFEEDLVEVHGNVTRIMNYDINLNSGKTNKQNSNEVIFDNQKSIQTKELDTLYGDDLDMFLSNFSNEQIDDEEILDNEEVEILEYDEL